MTRSATATSLSISPSPCPAGIRSSAAAPASAAPIPRSLGLLFAGLVGYVAFGKGFAYAGVPPVFVGEVLLVVVLVGSLRAAAPVPRHAAAVLALGVAGLAAVQLVVDRFVAADPVLETVRGLAPVYYVAFAFGLYALLRRLEGQVGRTAVVEAIDGAVDRVVPFVVVVAFGLGVLLVAEPAWVPVWPVSEAPVLSSKSTDLSVTLALLLPLLVARTRAVRSGPGSEAGRIPARLLMGMWLVATLLVAFRSRGAVLGLVAGCLVVRPDPVRAIKAVLGALAVVVVLYVTGISFNVAGREVSFDGAVESASSLLGSTSTDDQQGNFVGTKQWRTEWWSAIWSDVTGSGADAGRGGLDGGGGRPMLLHGHGWGDNLAVRYGVVPPGAESDPRVLRAPHNIFFSLAGRAGLVLAVGFVAAVVATVVVAARRRRVPTSSPTLLAARGAVVAALVTALTDVYIESPQGAILLWSLVGLLWWGSAATLTEPGPVSVPVPVPVSATGGDGGR
jgi:hypothetical protein